MHKCGVSLLLWLLVCSALFAQKREIARAEARFVAGEYMKAAELYRKYGGKVKDRELRTQVLFNLAECYRLTNQPQRAEAAYKSAVARGYPDPVAILYLADAQRSREKYDEALANYELYAQQVPTDKRGVNGAESCRQVQFWKENAENWQMAPLEGLNSRYHDYSGIYAGNGYDLIYFTSTRTTAAGPTMHGATGQKFADIFGSRKIDDLNWTPPVSLGDPVCSDMEEGAPSLSADLSTLYFTRCKKAEGEDFGCEIMVSKAGANNWSVAAAIPLGEQTKVFAHPAVSPDHLTLYFSSDMEGGYGGKDLWKITRSAVDQDWSFPINCGPEINTAGDEMFPTVREDGTLYFSSTGHPGFGGLDIFAAIPGADGRFDVRNAGYPLNSAADDYSIVFQGLASRGILTSSRGERTGDDLYFFDLSALMFTVSGIVKDELTGEPIPFARVRAVGSDGKTLEVETNPMGIFGFPLGPEADYVFLAVSNGYLNGRASATTKSLQRDTQISLSISMKSVSKPIEIDNIFYDFAKWDLRPEAKISLNELVIVLNDNPQIVVELGSHTDSRGSDADNIILSQKRAQAVVDYLIEMGIAPDRLVAKGYGESVPKIVSEEMRLLHPFMRVGVTLGELYIKTLQDEEQIEAAHQLNRRTEFKVLRSDYVADPFSAITPTQSR